jgi:hypothetical protein
LAPRCRSPRVRDAYCVLCVACAFVVAGEAAAAHVQRVVRQPTAGSHPGHHHPAAPAAVRPRCVRGHHRHRARCVPTPSPPSFSTLQSRAHCCRTHAPIPTSGGVHACVGQENPLHPPPPPPPPPTLLVWKLSRDRTLTPAHPPFTHPFCSPRLSLRAHSLRTPHPPPASLFPTCVPPCPPQST